MWADEDGKQNGLHANFKLSASGESLILLDDKQYQVDKVTFGAQQSDISYARIPNGTGPFTFQSHTFNKSNDVLGLTDGELKLADIVIYPNPAMETINIFINDDKDHKLKLCDIHGKIIYSNLVSGKHVINLPNCQNGIYICYIDQIPVKVQVLK